MSKRIAILFHEKQRRFMDIRGYAITFIAELWKQEGFDVEFLFGVKRYVPADLIIIHVDLSVVPEKYLRFARRYPIVLNGEVSDIRKSRFSQNLIRADDPYDGKVIVKSDLNCAGIQERALIRSPLGRRLERYLAKISPRRPYLEAPSDYLIFEHRRDVPGAYFFSKQLVVEKFLPETDGRLYYYRAYQFLGDRGVCTRLGSEQPIVKIGNVVSSEEVEPHPEVVALREKLQFDYGKFDYVMHDGRAVVLDINKTTGAAPNVTPEVLASRRERAAGIHSYFKS